MRAGRLSAYAPVLASAVPGSAWPAIPGPAGAAMLAMQWQLERSQWWSREQLIEQQFRQLRALAAHAVAHVPRYRKALELAGLRSTADLDPASFIRWPLLANAEARASEQDLYALTYPKGHGALLRTQTSGSTGAPLRIFTTEASAFFMHAMMVRDHLLHERDFSCKYAITLGRMQHDSQAGWGLVNAMFETGSAVSLGTSQGVERQLAWLMEEKPAYLHAHAANLRALLLLSRETGAVPQGMRQLISQGGTVPPDLRGLCREIWSADFADTYSCEEFGLIASQCPGHEHYLVNAENVYVEVLRDDGAPCSAGEIGRVVVTALHNFAMPLIRYELGDYAELGGKCPTGRGLPVLKRILGRSRGILRDPTGQQTFPAIPADVWLDVAPIRQFQVVQRTLYALDVRYVMERELSPYERGVIAKVLRERFGYPYDFAFERVESVPREPGGKFEDFVSLLPEAN